MNRKFKSLLASAMYTMLLLFTDFSTGSETIMSSTSTGAVKHQAQYILPVWFIANWYCAIGNKDK